MEEAPPPLLRCLRKCHQAERLNDDGVETPTSAEQRKVERSVEERVLAAHKQTHGDGSPPPPQQPTTLLRERHAEYLNQGLRRLSSAYACLDASRPWLCYWILHSLELLGRPVDAAAASDVCRFLARCQSPEGGFGGGPGQLAHLAPTYAAVCALCIVGTPEAYAVVDRQRLLDFLRSVRRPDGSFVMHVGGEVDVRGAYCAAAVASLVGVLSSSSPGLFEGTAGWILRCQSWEGGLGGAPGLEAHGGYTFCGAATMALLGELETLDVRALLRWAAGRQMRFEGGFQGRCNKLVDGCYSFWQGGLLALIRGVCREDGRSGRRRRKTSLEAEVLGEESNLSCDKTAFVEEKSNLSSDKAAFLDESNLSHDEAVFVEDESNLSCDNAVFGGEGNLSRQTWLFDQQALQEYILLCCQNPAGGLVDKPGKARDFYHTCYCLSGLSVAQHSGNTDLDMMVGQEENRLARTHPVYNMSPEKVARALQHFKRLPVPASDRRQAPESPLKPAEVEAPCGFAGQS